MFRWFCIIVGSIVVFAIGILSFSLFMSRSGLWGPAVAEEKFIGTITEIDTGCWVDGTCSMTIDGKKVIFGRGWSKSEWGKLIDFGPDTLSSYNGKTVEVYAQRLTGFYTLEGSKEYYIKLVLNERSTEKRVNERRETQAVDYVKTLQAIAQDIESLKKEFPQLKEFSASKNLYKERLTISYTYNTHDPEPRPGWRGAVPEPDDDGMWFVIEFYEPDSQDQRHTQPFTIPLYFGEKRVLFLIQEGNKTNPVGIGGILKKHGVQELDFLLERIEGRMRYFMEDKNIQATFTIEDGALIVEHTIVPRLVVQRMMIREPGPVRERMAPADDGFRIRVWTNTFDPERIEQAVRPQEYGEYDPDGKEVYRVYLGTTGPFPNEGEQSIQYNIEYGPKIKNEFVDEINKIIDPRLKEEQKLIPQYFSFFKKARILLKATPTLNTGDTQRAIDAETGLEYWKYIAVKDGKEIEIGDLYLVKEDGTTETHAEKFNALIKEEKLNLSKNQAKEFAEMVLNISFGSVYSGGKIQKVVEEKGIFKATARLRWTIGMVPYHKESDLEFTFNKDGTLIQFKQGKWEEVEGQ